MKLHGGHVSGAGIDTMERVLGYKPVLAPDERDCPTCQATGINPVDRSLVCPKCEGERKVKRNDPVCACGERCWRVAKDGCACGFVGDPNLSTSRSGDPGSDAPSTGPSRKF